MSIDKKIIIIDYSEILGKMMEWSVELLGTITRVYPNAARAEILQIYNAIEGLVQDDKRTANLEDSCIKGLIWTGHHLQLQVCKFLNNWKPKFQFNCETEELIANFVGTRAKRFAQKTVTIQKKQEMRKRRNMN